MIITHTFMKLTIKVIKKLFNLMPSAHGPSGSEGPI